MGKQLTNANVRVHFIVILIVMLIPHTCHFISYAHLQLHNEQILIPVRTSISMCIIIDININQPHLFEWPQGMCEHGGRARDITSAQYVY